MPPFKRKLFGLPSDYTEILNKVLTYECPHGASVSGKSKSVAMCLICGEMLCYEVIFGQKYFTFFLANTWCSIWIKAKAILKSYLCD